MRFAGVVLSVALLALQLGCKQKPQDAVLDQYKAGENAIALKNPVEYRNTLTPESLQRYEDAKRLALEASADETRQLSPSVMSHVLTLRNRLTAERLRLMSVDDLLVWEIDEGYLVVDKEMGIAPCGVTIAGDTAVVQLGEEVARKPKRATGLAVGLIASAAAGTEVIPIEGLVAHYQRINGYWYCDQVTQAVASDKAIVESAKEENQSVPDYLLAAEQEQHGSIKQGIWEPLGK
jgi:hypothetical protein